MQTHRALPRALSLAILSVATASPAMAQSTAAAGRVLLISCDGLRPDAIEKAGMTNIQRLIAAGSYQPRGRNQNPPVTVPNHTSMVTGLTVDNHGVRGNHEQSGELEATTIFDVATRAGLRVAFFASKPKLEFLCRHASAGVYRIQDDIEDLTTEVVSAIRTYDPQLTFIHYSDPDKTGHKKGWMSRQYLAAAQRVDRQIGRVVQALQDKGALDQTTIIITADHGGHWTGHYLNISVDRTIPIVIKGPGVGANRTLEADVNVIDVPATALAVLGLPTSSARDGKVIDEAFNGRSRSAEAPGRSAAARAAYPLLAGSPIAGIAILLLVGWQKRRSRRMRSLP